MHELDSIRIGIIRIIDYIEIRNAKAAERLHSDIVTLAESLCDRPFSQRYP
jgi:plasmid stabilization system protein ParE